MELRWTVDFVDGRAAMIYASLLPLFVSFLISVFPRLLSLGVVVAGTGCDCLVSVEEVIWC